MTRILLTGGSGFIATHVLETLLQRGHSVVTTVRSPQKGKHILDAHPRHARDTLDFVVVEDIARSSAFDKAVVSDPPFEAVVHTASPYHFKSQDNKKELLEPAINGTVGLLEAIYKNAPTVKRVVITSSSAAILDQSQPTKADWCPVTEEQALIGPANGYRASKTFAERAAWKFVEEKKPNFSLAVCNPPLVLGPVLHHLESLTSLNTSNQRIRDLITGAAKDACPPTGNHLFVDVRDLALGHALAVEKDEAAGKRFFMVGGKFSNKEIAEIVADEFPELREKLPSGEALKPGDYPERGSYGFDNSRSREVLGLTYRPLKDSVVDAVKSLQRFTE
ncbi:Major facilitator superfamily [Macrophomina phaseolina MS6]|uniref:Major facilitator superfamily n=1 Tax=Macrophomina phaseolina (strain MS6) TaxID=1126212 RepID=K2S1X5_MACPH|nr:Major facilitator superfamily [Macrophomina phaseolina MS6]